MRTPFWHRLHDFFLPHERNGYRPHVFRIASVAVILLVIALLELGSLAQIALVFPNTNFLASVLPGVLATLTNDARVSAHAPAVIENPLLDRAAQLAASDMAAKGYFAHVSPDGKTPWYWLHQAGYQYSYAGENLAVNFSDSQTLQSAWMASPTHEANIVNPSYTQVGFGTANGVYDGAQTTFVVEFFAAPAVASAAPEKTPRPVAVAPVQKPLPATATGSILGTETNAAPSTAPQTPAKAEPARASFLALLLSSPVTTVASILSALFVLVALLLFAAFLRHRRMPHPRVLIAAALLLALSSGLVAANPLLLGRVQLLAHDSLSASAFSGTTTLAP